MCIYIYIYIHTYIHTNIHTYMYWDLESGGVGQIAGSPGRTASQAGLAVARNQ